MSVTWNPSDKSSRITLSFGNLRATHTGNQTWGGVRADISKASGKWYWEIYYDNDAASSCFFVGIGNSSAGLESEFGGDVNGYSYGDSNGNKKHNGSSVNYGDSFTTTDMIGVALDLDNHKIWWSKNNVWPAGGDPAAGTNEAYSGIAAGSWFPMRSSICGDNIDTARFNIVDQFFSPPAGFTSICPDTGLILTSPLSATETLSSKFQIDSACPSPLTATTDLTASEVRLGDIVPDNPLVAAASFSAITHVETSPCIFTSTSSGQAIAQVEISAGALPANAILSCDHCFNYAQISSSAPTPTCKMAAVFRYARIEAEAPTPTASFRVGKKIEGECPVPSFTCTAHSGRNPSIIANAPVPTCSMRVGLSLTVDAGAPVPTCSMVADTHHIANLLGNVPTPTCTIVADTENIAIISAPAPCPRGLFTVTVGNVASVYGRVPVPTCSLRAINGIVVSLRGEVPIPGPLVRFHASLMNVNITLEGNVPVPTMTSSVLCSMPSLVLRHERGEVR